MRRPIAIGAVSAGFVALAVVLGATARAQSPKPIDGADPFVAVERIVLQYKGRCKST